MKIKNKRQSAILEIIKNNNVETQEDLTKLLSEAGINSTQATVSRDINELHLIKVLDKVSGKYRYEQRSTFHEHPIMPNKSVGILRDGIIELKIAQNIVVVKCYAGMASGVCAALDSLHRSEIVGTLAGDDTIFIATESLDSSAKLVEELSMLVFEK